MFPFDDVIMRVINLVYDMSFVGCNINSKLIRITGMILGQLWHVYRDAAPLKLIQD